MPDGFDALFTTHYAAVYRLAYRIAGTREEAEDLAQEAFLRLHRSPRVWQGKCPGEPGCDDSTIRPWLYRVVTNLAYNVIRARGRRQRREQRVGVGHHRDGDEPVDDAVDLTERAVVQETVRAALASLDERQVQLLLLRQEGLSYREIAAAIKVAPGSVGTLLARAEAAFEKAYRKVEER